MKNEKWWKKAVIYQIYPRSFKDSAGNGIGDLQGIIKKIDYLQDLGISAIWLSPIYPSPMEDFGYDISNYIDIHPDFGTLGDLDLLIEEAHKRNIKIILDYVANHTSDQHPWFLESKKSKNNPKSDYYIWKDPKIEGSVPNNWLCVPGGSAWEWSEERQQYYYHSYLKCQPDVNWKNQELQNEMLNVLRFWMKRGIDGFRIDMISWLFKDPEWRDNPPNPDYNPKTDFSFQKLLRTYTTDLPGLFNYLKLISDTVNEFDDKLIVGEISYATPLEVYPKYYGSDGNLVHLPAMFEFLKQDWSKESIENILRKYYAILPPFAWPNFQLGNHDRSRVVSRFGGLKQARAAAVLLLTLKGSPFIYNGEELGMSNVDIPEDKIQDPTAKMESGLSRDPYRTPMQWNSNKNAGFTTGVPWLPVGPEYTVFNVEEEIKTEDSILNLYRKLLQLRNSNKTLQTGDIELLDLTNKNCLGYNRIGSTKPEFRIYINFSENEQKIEVNNKYIVVLNSYLDSKTKNIENEIVLREFEAVILQLT